MAGRRCPASWWRWDKVHSRAGRPFCLSPSLCRQPQPADGGHGLLRAGTGRDRALHLVVLLDPAAGLFGVFSFTVPAVILSGYISPVENMPQVFQWLAAIDPSPTSSCCSGVFLKGFDWSAAWPCSGPCSPSPASPCRWRSPCSAAISPDAPPCSADAGLAQCETGLFPT